MMKYSKQDILVRVYSLGRMLPAIFVKHYTWIFIFILCVCIAISSFIFYMRAYSVIVKQPEGRLQRVIISEDTLEAVQDEIKRREEKFSNPPEAPPQNPF